MIGERRQPVQQKSAGRAPENPDSGGPCLSPWRYQMIRREDASAMLLDYFTMPLYPPAGAALKSAAAD